MSSIKSTSNSQRPARAPQRQRGVLRVASLLEAGAAVIAERGFEAATMAEIAARAGAQIGSLYRFFPCKDALADALFQRYGELVEEAFGKIEAEASSSSVEDLADSLVQILVGLHGETRAMVALLEARSEWSRKRTEFRAAALERIARVLTLRAPRLNAETARDIAVVLLHNMKTMKLLTFEPGSPSSPGAQAEMCAMNRLYLASRLSEKQP